jgi:hypothetical protein
MEKIAEYRTERESVMLRVVLSCLDQAGLVIFLKSRRHRFEEGVGLMRRISIRFSHCHRIHLLCSHNNSALDCTPGLGRS